MRRAGLKAFDFECEIGGVKIREMEEGEVRSIWRAILARAGSFRAAILAIDRQVSAVRRRVGLGSLRRRRDSFRPSAQPRAIKF